METILFIMDLLLLTMDAQAAEHSLSLTSPAFQQDGEIPSLYTCDGKDISPPLQWSNAPEETKSFVLILNDPDAPSGPKDHWILFNIPAGMNGLRENMKKTPGDLKFGKKSFPPNNLYKGPCPPDREHRYIFSLFALDSPPLKTEF